MLANPSPKCAFPRAVHFRVKASSGKRAKSRDRAAGLMCLPEQRSSDYLFRLFSSSSPLLSPLFSFLSFFLSLSADCYVKLGN